MVLTSREYAKILTQRAHDVADTECGINKNPTHYEIGRVIELVKEWAQVLGYSVEQ